MKIDVGMSTSNVYHPNTFLYAYFVHHHPYLVLQFLHLFMLIFFIMILHFITASKVESFACVYYHLLICVHYTYMSVADPGL